MRPYEPRYASTYGLRTAPETKSRGRSGNGADAGPGRDVLKAVSQLQRESEAALALEAESAQINQQLALQVAALQRGFASLAYAVLEELEAVRDESQRWPDERSSWVNAMAKLKEDMQKKVDHMEARHEDAQVALDKAWQENQQLRAENDMLHHRLSDLEGRSNELTRHLEQVKRGLSTVQQSGGDMKEALTTLATKVDAREAIQRTLGRTIADLEARMRDEVGRLRDDTTNTCRALQSDAEALAGDMESLRTWCHQLDASHRNHVADTTQRLAHVEAGPDLGPILAAVQQIEDRMGNMGRAQDSATTRLEAGLGRLNSDYADVASRIENADATIQALRRAVREHHEALVRSASVFASALNISSPVSEVSLAAALSPGAGAHHTVYSGAPYGSTVRPASYHVPTNATWGAHPSSIARGRVPRSMSPAR